MANEGVTAPKDSEEPRWSDGERLSCPALTYFDDIPVGRWLAVKEPPPCAKKTCGMDQCHNFGSKYRPEVSSGGLVRFQIVSKR